MNIKPYISMLCFGCAAVKPLPPISPPPVVAKKQSFAQAQVIQNPVAQKLHIHWPNDPWLQSGSWIVVESPEPQGPYLFYAQTTHDWIDIPMTNSQHFFNYCRAEDYAP